MSLSTSAGTRIYIGTKAAAANLTQFEADTYVEIKGVEDIGEFGDTAEVDEFVELGSARMRRVKGARDAGLLEIVCGREPLDAGQRAVIAAEKSDDDYNFKVVASDAPSGGSPTTYYMRIAVVSAKVNFSGADAVTRLNFSLAINSEILEEVAEAA